MLALLLLLQAPPAAAPAPARDVVVTGERLKQLHDRCRAGACSPKRDAQVSIAWAEALLRAGDYRRAKLTLRDATGRNKGHAATDPKPVAALYEAYATVAWQEGDQDVYREAVADRVQTLNDHLPPSDVFRRSAALALGDMWLRLGRPFDAERAYGHAAREAEAADQPDVTLRALLAQARARGLLRNRSGALEVLARAEAVPGANTAAARGAIAVTRLSVATRAEPAQRAGVEAALATLRDANLPAPVLVWAPPAPVEAATAARRALNRVGVTSSAAVAGNNGFEAADMSAIRWADIGFWVRPDGRVAEAEVLRGSNSLAWAQRYVAWIAARRYAPVTSGPDEGSYRVERLTLRGEYGVPKGSLIRRRIGNPELQVIDLTQPAARATPPA